MKCGVPVLGKVPDIMPEWMSEDNGIWIADKNMIVDFVSDFIQNWLEDNLNPEMFIKMEETVNKYSDFTEFEKQVWKIFEEYQIKRGRIFRKSTTKITK